MSASPSEINICQDTINKLQQLNKKVRERLKAAINNQAQTDLNLSYMRLQATCSNWWLNYKHE